MVEHFDFVEFGHLKSAFDHRCLDSDSVIVVAEREQIVAAAMLVVNLVGLQAVLFDSSKEFWTPLFSVAATDDLNRPLYMCDRFRRFYFYF